MTQHDGQAVADTAERAPMDQAFDAIRAALTAAYASGLADGRNIYDMPGEYLDRSAENAACANEAGTAKNVTQVAMWQALYSALSDVAGR